MKTKGTGGNGRAGGSLADKEVAFTGRLASMTHEQARQLVADCGGRYVAQPGERTDCLVVGEVGWPLRADGRLTRSLERARDLRHVGRTIEIVSEHAFLERLGVARGEGAAAGAQLYTDAQLGRILGVSRQDLRRWARAGLIRPARTVHRLAYYEFRQVAVAKTLAELLARGVSLARIRRSLQELRRWMPELREPLAQLSFLDERAAPLLRLEDGSLVEPSGQQVFDFLAPAAARPADVVRCIDTGSRPAEAGFEQAVRFEDAGRLEEAAGAYRRALLAEGPQVELCFNLANVLYALGEKEKAVERFRQAVELDPQFVEAWNNLGNTLADLGALDDATAAFERALEVEPDYADAHYNLAETLSQQGRDAESRPHWEAYLVQDPHSVWAQHVRERIAAGGGAAAPDQGGR